MNWPTISPESLTRKSATGVVRTVRAGPFRPVVDLHVHSHFSLPLPGKILLGTIEFLPDANPQLAHRPFMVKL